MLEEDKLDELRCALLDLIEDIEHRVVVKGITEGNYIHYCPDFAFFLAFRARLR